MTLDEHIAMAEWLLSESAHRMSDENPTPVLPGTNRPLMGEVAVYTHSQLVARAAVHARLALAIAQAKAQAVHIETAVLDPASWSEIDVSTFQFDKRSHPSGEHT